MRRYSLEALVLAAVALSVSAAILDHFPGDKGLSLWLQRADAGWFEEMMELASWLGRTFPLVLLVAAVVVPLSIRFRRFPLLALAMAASGTVLPGLLKAIIERPRPTVVESISIYSASEGYSFPSGHAFNAMLVLGMACYMAQPLCRGHLAAVVSLRVATSLLILLIGASRVYLGAHWTSDVVGGYVLGGLVLVAIISLLETLARRGKLSWLA